MSFFRKTKQIQFKMNDSLEVQLASPPGGYQSFGLSPSEDSWSVPTVFSPSADNKKAQMLLKKNAQCCDNCDNCICKCKCWCVVL